MESVTLHGQFADGFPGLFVRFVHSVMARCAACMTAVPTAAATAL